MNVYAHSKRAQGDEEGAKRAEETPDAPKQTLRTQDDLVNAGRDENADPAKGPGTTPRLKEASRNADAMLERYVDSSYPRYVFRKGSGRVQGDTGAFTAESMIVHRPEEFQSLIDSGIWCRSPAEAGEMSKEDKEKRGIRQASDESPAATR